VIYCTLTHAGNRGKIEVKLMAVCNKCSRIKMWRQGNGSEESTSADWQIHPQQWTRNYNLW